MSKMILTGLCAFAALGLAACGEKAEENNMAIENVEELNTTEDMNMDMNATDMNATPDMNAANDMIMTANTMGNETTGNSTGY
jgi:galactitol-specific phosphotransferase system IIB component